MAGVKPGRAALLTQSVVVFTISRPDSVTTQSCDPSDVGDPEQYPCDVAGVPERGAVRRRRHRSHAIATMRAGVRR